MTHQLCVHRSENCLNKHKLHCSPPSTTILLAVLIPISHKKRVVYLKGALESFQFKCSFALRVKRSMCVVCSASRSIVRHSNSSYKKNKRPPQKHPRLVERLNAAQPFRWKSCVRSTVAPSAIRCCYCCCCCYTYFFFLFCSAPLDVLWVSRG